MHSGSNGGSGFDATDEQWSPGRWTGELGPMVLDAIDRLAPERAAGERPLHRDGYVLRGTFQRSKAKVDRSLLASFTDFVPFVGEDDDVAVIARISSLNGGLDRPGVLGLAVKMVPTDDEPTDLLSLTMNSFPTATPRAFTNLLEALAMKPRGAPRIAVLAATRRVHIRSLYDFVLASRINHGSGLASSFNGLQTFHLVTKATNLVSVRGNGGLTVSTPMRYRWVPKVDNTVGTFGDLVRSNEFPETRFDLHVYVHPLGARATKSEVERLHDPRVEWDHSARRIHAGTMVLTERMDEYPGELGFNPAMLAQGITMGDSSLFSARQTAYNRSFARRAKEAKP